MTALSPAEVDARVDALRAGPALTELQAARLRAIVRILDEHGRFLLRAALDAAEFPTGQTGGQDAFQDFRKRVNEAAAASGVDLQLELDARKTTPDRRYGWFTGGDLVDEGIAAFTGKAADDTGIAHPIEPEVTELGASRRSRVYVSVAPADARSTSTRQLVDMLGQHLQLDGDRNWEIADPGSVGPGEDLENALDRLCARADVRVVLLSPSYLTDAANAGERDRVLHRPGRRVVFALTGLPGGTPTLGPLGRRDVRRREHPWAQLRGDQQRKQYIDDLVDALHAEFSVPAQSAAAPDVTAELVEHTKRLADRRGGNDSTVLVDAEVSETTFTESRLNAPERGPALSAVARLLEWATAEVGPQLCALLGDVGLGKTTTAKLFARALLDKRPTGAPLPLLFDLRDVRAADLARAITLDAIVDSMLEASRPAGVPRERLSADTVRRRLLQGDAVVIFDGLDEALVHLGPHDQRLFIRQLWRVIESSPRTRLLLTCRTQYFRTIRDEVTFFTGDDRPGPQGKDYLALLMLPFGPRQIRNYLAANLNAQPEKVEAFLALIGSVHDLADLSRRPMTLKLISDQVEFIETAKLRGRQVRAVDLYGEVVDRWLARDSGKHNLLPDHKHLLMEAIAGEIWRSGRNSWTANDVDNWLLELLDQRPDLRRHYRENAPDLWKTDFRTATFLSREDDEFQFGHRSLFEYFLARYLVRALGEVSAAGAGALAMPVPGPETLDFLGQCLAAATPQIRAAALGGLAAIRDHYTPGASELAFAYALRAAGRGHPHHQLPGIQLPGANLAGWTIGRPEASGYALSLIGANFRGADLGRARIHHVDLTGADLTDARLNKAELHDSRLNRARLDRALVAAALFRGCEIDNVDFGRTVRHRTQLLWCTPSPPQAEGLLLAPLPPEEGVPPPGTATPWIATGHTGMVSSVAWSPDGSRLATGGGDGTVRIWDLAAGAKHRQLARNTGAVNSVAWSPDGSRLATGGDGVVRIWDVASDTEHVRLTDSASSVAWSPDGSRLAAGGEGVVRVWDAASGNEYRQLAGDVGLVNSVAWSPDGSRLATGGDGVVQVWDLASGAEQRAFSDHTRWMRSVAWSPDGSRLATCGDGVVLVWDVATGAEHLRVTVSANSVAWSPDGGRLATGGDAGLVLVWDAASGAEHLRLAGNSGSGNAVAWSPDGSRLAAAGRDGVVRVWDVASGAEHLEFAGYTDWILSVAWSPDGSRLATVGQGAVVRVWDAATGAERLKLASNAGSGNSVAWSPDGSRLATGGEAGVVLVWDAVTGAEHLKLAGRVGSVNSVAWSPDGSRLATAVRGAIVRVWDVASGSEHARFTVSANSVAWSPDGSRLATVGRDGVVRVWDLASGGEHARFTASANSVAWSPDGSRLATAGGVVRIWDVATGAEHFQLARNTGVGHSVAWSPDGSRLATGGNDGIVRVWDLASGAEQLQIAGHTDWIRSVAWSPDGSRLATGGDDATLRTWNASNGQADGFVAHILADDQSAIVDAASGNLIGASPGAWRWIFWSHADPRWPDGLPAEAFGPLPPLPAP